MVGARAAGSHSCGCSCEAHVCGSAPAQAEPSALLPAPAPPSRQDNLHETPVYGGWVDAKGPRYCPSIEDKIVR